MPKKENKRYWFRRKYYGWGWYPATWEAWVILLFYVIILTINAFRIDQYGLTAGQIMPSIFPATAILTILLVLICYQTGESPLWQWGPPKSEKLTKKVSKKKKKKN